MAPTDTRSPLPGLLTPARTPGPAAPARTQEQTPARIPRRNPPGPGPSGKCFDCGGSHHRRDCPTKRDFCVRYGFLFSTLSVLLTFRCLSKTGEHKHWQCPALQDCCHICSGNGLGEAAYGHTRYTPLIDFFYQVVDVKYIQQQIILLLCLLYLESHYSRFVHYETDRAKRDQICQILPKACFSAWFDKRKHEN